FLLLTTAVLSSLFPYTTLFRSRIVVFDQALENISKKKRNVRGRAVGAGQPLRHGRKKCPINVCHRVHKEEFLRSGSHPREYSKGRGRGREEQHLLLSGMRDPHQFGGCRWSTCRPSCSKKGLCAGLQIRCAPVLLRNLECLERACARRTPFSRHCFSRLHRHGDRGNRRIQAVRGPHPLGVSRSS